ncbi:PREDICTED: uncharacterized protein LOC105368780 [Ceratosolen solmsi marchali]|uniref:Uncharacterized protein LOC105368780 n=1 Tax=Ceratosolen solmsi marchali TaxID=326594 RepID=A0AAJ6YXG4_9HYME|nr:PREDICTED: uncharacterized protein LOC105368780 [Ceratosolen solmsi marchali]
MTLQEERAGGPGSDSCESCESRDGRDGRECQEVTSLEEAKAVIVALKARQRAQAHQMLAWRRTLKLQEELVARLTRENAEQLRSLSSQLLLFESRLCRKQKEIETNLAQREAIILRQQRVIRQLQNKLRHAAEPRQAKSFGSGSGGGGGGGDGDGDGGDGEDDGDGAGGDGCVPKEERSRHTAGRRDSPLCDALDRLDSLGDSDSAVVLEEAFLDDPAPPRFRSNITDVTVIRSVSDAVEPANNKYCASMRRCNGLLRRPEVLETVYSVEEDGDGDRADNEEEEADEEDNSELEPRCPEAKPRLRDIYGSFERLAQQEAEAAATSARVASTAPSPSAQRTRDESQQQAQVTYNRVMSNHRSVTKPKDVKYKRINKAKSKSLEELRGRLRNWVEKGNKIAISLDQSYA